MPAGSQSKGRHGATVEHRRDGAVIFLDQMLRNVIARPWGDERQPGVRSEASLGAPRWVAGLSWSVPVRAGWFRAARIKVIAVAGKSNEDELHRAGTQTVISDLRDAALVRPVIAKTPYHANASRRSTGGEDRQVAAAFRSL